MMARDVGLTYKCYLSIFYDSVNSVDNHCFPQYGRDRFNFIIITPTGVDRP